jgi:hypothetical protein
VSRAHYADLPEGLYRGTFEGADVLAHGAVVLAVFNVLGQGRVAIPERTLRHRTARAPTRAIVPGQEVQLELGPVREHTARATGRTFRVRFVGLSGIKGRTLAD